MKAKIRETGEIVDIIDYNVNTSSRSISDFVSYTDSKGIVHSTSLNYYWDFEPIEQSNSDFYPHWQDVKERAAIAAMQGIITILGSSDYRRFTDIVAEGFTGSKKTYPNEIAEFSVACADALVEELKKK